jgi:FkbM family methyltransferase
VSRIPARLKALSDPILRRFDLELRRYRHSLRAKRARLLDQGGVDLVLDVGANVGRYAVEIRAGGYRGKILSFEPLPDAFAALARRATSDPFWEARHTAIGPDDGLVAINLAANSVSSSVLAMTSRHLEAAPSSHTVGSLDVPMMRLDSVRSSECSGKERVHLKLDVQGYEFRVLEGAASTLSQAVSVEAELSLVPLYEGQALMAGVVDLLQDAGFQLIWVERGLLDPRTEHMLQLDGLFVKWETT